MYSLTVWFTHWIPILTICPFNKLPDLIYIRVMYDDGKFRNLYNIRKSFRKYWFCMQYMEDIAERVYFEHPMARQVEVRLLFSKHVITLTRPKLPHRS